MDILNVMEHNGLSMSVNETIHGLKESIRMWRGILLSKDLWELDSNSYLNIQADLYTVCVSAIPPPSKTMETIQAPSHFITG